MKNKNRKRGLGALIFVAVFAAIVAIVMLLWNCLIPNIIGWSAVNYWQAAGLVLLCRLLLGSFGKFMPMSQRLLAHKAKKWEHFDPQKMMRFHEKMGGMSASERREYIRNRMRECEPDFERFSCKETNSEKESAEDKD